MKRVVLALTMLAAFSARGAVLEPISFLHPDQDSAYETLAGPSRVAAKALFSGLRKLGLVSDLLRVNGEHSFSPGLLFSQLREAPLRELANCEAVFCRDVELQKSLNDEMRRGRLVLIANSDNGFVAAMVAPTPETEALQDVLTPDFKRRPRNVLIVTPKTLMSSLAHERTHAEDAENGTMLPLLERVRGLLDKGRLSLEQSKAVQQFAGEVRAYEQEMRYLVSKSRELEFVADDADPEASASIQVRTAPRRDFLVRRLSEIDWKVRDWYLPAFVKAVKGKKLPKAERKSLLVVVKGLLPPSGPYSFANLVEPRLR